MPQEYKAKEKALFKELNKAAALARRKPDSRSNSDARMIALNVDIAEAELQGTVTTRAPVYSPTLLDSPTRDSGRQLVGFNLCICGE